MIEERRRFRTGDEAGRQRALDRLDVLDTPPEPAFEKITNLVATVFDVPIAAVTLIDRDRQWFKSQRGLEDSETAREVAFCNHTIRASRCLKVEDATRDPRFADNPSVVGPPRIRSYLGAPLITSDGYAIGALCAVDYKVREFSPEQERVLASFADLVMNELELRQSASRDSLTGLATRRTFIEALEKVLEGRDEAALLFLDLDHFKAINDTFGHPAGDEVLKAAAVALMEVCPENAVAGRLGGEELGLVLPAVSETQARDTAEAVRDAIAHIRFGAYPDLRVTTSIGLAMRSGHGRRESWMTAADAALYEAKSDGRNCVRFAQPIWQERA